jgi:hypothetical protein
VSDWIVLTKENMLAAVLVASGFLIWWSVKFLAREVIIPGRNACLAHLKNTDRCMRAMTKTIVRIHERLQRIEARVSKRREISESPDELSTEDEEDEPL